LYTAQETMAEVVPTSWDRSSAGNWNAGKATVVKDIKLTK